MMQTQTGRATTHRPRVRPLPAAAGREGPPRPAQSPPAEGTARYQAALLEHQDFIHRTVASLARRYAMKPWDAEDLEGQVMLRLVVDDYAVLRKFRGRSRLTTYLTTVIHNIFRDFRIQRWGKWRPSASARRLGDLGVQLEALLYRDRFATGEAITILRERFDVTASDEQLWTIAVQLKPRTTRRFESEAALLRLQSPEQADAASLEADRANLRERAEAVLRRVLAGLEPEERLILRMRFADSLTIRAIATTLGEPPRRMYARMRRLLVELRRRIEEQGVGCDEVLELLDRPAEDLDAGLADSPASS